MEFTLLDENNSGINTSTLIVEISGQRAVEGATFSPGFSGIYSEINVDLNTLNVIINKETEYKEDSILNIKIQIQDYSDKYYNFDYSFKVVTSKPFIFVIKQHNYEKIYKRKFYNNCFNNFRFDIVQKLWRLTRAIFNKKRN